MTVTDEGVVEGEKSGVGGVTVKITPLLATPLTVTTTLPLVAPLGTGTVMPLSPQLVGVAAVPLNVTVLVPCVTPKLVPLIVTDVAGGRTGSMVMVVHPGGTTGAEHVRRDRFAVERKSPTNNNFHPI